MYIVTGSDKLLQSCRQLSQHLTYYSKGAVALLLKLCTDEKLHKQSLKKPNSPCFMQYNVYVVLHQRPDKGLMLKMSTLETLYSNQITSSTLLINQLTRNTHNPHSTSFFGNFTPPPNPPPPPETFKALLSKLFPMSDQDRISP